MNPHSPDHDEAGLWRSIGGILAESAPAQRFAAAQADDHSAVGHDPHRVWAAILFLLTATDDLWRASSPHLAYRHASHGDTPRRPRCLAPGRGVAAGATGPLNLQLGR